MNKAQALRYKHVMVTETKTTGVVVDWTDNGLTVLIERDSDGDWIHALVSEITVLPEQQPTNEDKFEDALKQAGFTWDGYREGEATTYCIDGFTYALMVTLEEDGSFYLETTHKERQRNIDSLSDETAYANTTTRKTLKGAMNYIIKYTDK